MPVSQQQLQFAVELTKQALANAGDTMNVPERTAKYLEVMVYKAQDLVTKSRQAEES